MGKHVLVTGASGWIGQSLVARFAGAGLRVTTLGRRPGGNNTRVWSPADGKIDLAGLPRIDAVVHLAGENVADGRWTRKRRRAILESRQIGTRLLAEAVAGLSQPPPVFVTASGISAYRADGMGHDESDPIDTTTFLGQVVQAWEAAADPARAAGCRVVHLRLGVVLGPGGGTLAKLLPIFRLGLGGPLGNGAAGFSWIALDDVVEIFRQACLDPAYDGVINAVAPGLATNREFTRALGRVLRRPAILSVPRLLPRVLFGQMAEETVLADLRVSPAKLQALGYPFLFPQLEPALRHILGK